MFEFSDIADNELGLVYTKWDILKIGASFLDPLELVCPVVLQAKLLFLELCELKVDWCEVVDSDVAKTALTLPRLELLACLLLSKLVVLVRKALEVEVKIESVMLKSDSEIVLHWIRGLRKEWNQWVENRVTKIQSLVGTEYWRFVLGESILQA